jgi:DNA polymerase-3 subunit delta'
MNDGFQAWLQHPSHAVLLTGSAEITSTGAADASQALLQGHQEYLRYVTPDNKGTIAISQVRELIAFFQLKVPGTADIRRMAIIEQAQAMTREAQNALLKLLEEPPADSVLLLTAERPQELLATIRSRVQTIHLGDQAGAPETEAVQLVKQALAGSAYDRLLLVDSALKSRDTANLFVTTLATVAEATLAATARKNGATERWQRVLRAAYVAEDALERSGNTKLVLTELMLAL